MENNNDPMKKQESQPANQNADVWDDKGDFVDPTLQFDERTGDYYQKKVHTQKIKQTVEQPKPIPKYTPKQPNSKNKQKQKINPNIKWNEYDEEDYNYDD